MRQRHWAPGWPWPLSPGTQGRSLGGCASFIGTELSLQERTVVKSTDSETDGPSSSPSCHLLVLWLGELFGLPVPQFPHWKGGVVRAAAVSGRPEECPSHLCPAGLASGSAVGMCQVPLLLRGTDRSVPALVDHRGEPERKQANHTHKWRTTAWSGPRAPGRAQGALRAPDMGNDWTWEGRAASRRAGR